tara:strand:+ start:1117 stop:2037 length:921 start_codon:yes stop_codon:yes gene_type:complete
MENFLYFAAADVTTGADNASDAIMVRASNYKGADVGATSSVLYFSGANGDPEGVAEITLTHTAAKNKAVHKAITALLAGKNNGTGFTVAADFEDTTDHTGGTKKAIVDSTLKNLGCTAVSIRDHRTTGMTSGVSAGATWNSYGAGAVSTAGAPVYSQYRDKGTIVTKILVNLDGMLCKGDAANDALGITGGGAAYIGRYVTDNMGILYGVDVACIQVPGEQTATITTDIDIAFNSSASIAYDGACGTAEINTGGFANVGRRFIGGLTAAATANDYIYLVEGDTAATTGEYSTGKLLLTFYGHQINF